MVPDVILMHRTPALLLKETLSERSVPLLTTPLKVARLYGVGAFFVHVIRHWNPSYGIIRFARGNGLA
jgi:hypothetical protein